MPPAVRFLAVSACDSGAGHVAFLLHGVRGLLRSRRRAVCTITASDSYTPLTGPTTAPAAIGVSITTVSGLFQ